MKANFEYFFRHIGQIYSSCCYLM